MSILVHKINQRGDDFEQSNKKDLEIFEKHFGKINETWKKRFLKYMDKVN